MDQTDDWRQKKKLTEKGGHLLKSSLWYDCCFVVKEENSQKEFRAHKLFLAMASPVFEAMFFGPLAEKGDFIPVEDVTSISFKLLLEYIYSDIINIKTFIDARDVYYAARKYLMSDLEKICEKKFYELLTPATAGFLYEFASVVENTALKNEAEKVISNQTLEVMKDSSFKELQLSTLEALLDMEKLSISSEAELFDAVLCWAKSECARKGLEENLTTLNTVTESLLPKIRFLTMEFQQMAQGPASSPLLTHDECFTIFMNISSCNLPMPQRFSTSRAKRKWPQPIQNVQIVKQSAPKNPESCTISFKIMDDICIYGVQVQHLNKQQSGYCEYVAKLWRSDTPQQLVQETKQLKQRSQASLFGQTLLSNADVIFLNASPLPYNTTYFIEVEVHENNTSYFGNVTSNLSSTVVHQSPSYSYFMLENVKLIKSILYS